MKDFFAFLVEIFIGLHTLGFEMISECTRDYRIFGLGFAITDVILGILTIIVMLLLDAFILYGFYCLIRRISITVRTKEIKHYNVIGTVVAKKYEPPHTTYTTVSTGKVTTLIPHHHPERYIVQVQYDDIIEDFCNESLYNIYQENEPINLVLIHKLDKNNEIIEATLELPE